MIKAPRVITQPHPVRFDRSVAALIDHTILRADATRADVVRICEEALKYSFEYSFASVCVNGCWVPLVAEQLAGSEVKVCSVVGFPLGAMATAAKRAEGDVALKDGALELDMVLNVGALKAGEPDAVRSDISAVVQAAHSAGAIVKVILETALLTDEQKLSACRLAVDAGADFVKTSTGFGPSGATVADIALMRSAVGPVVGVKASGGIRTIEQLRAMVAAGASRVGASASVAIVEASAG
jgi:deoxyribose-phosphate aldolase